MMVDIYDMQSGKKIERGNAEEISEKYFENNCLVISLRQSDTIYNSKLNKIFKVVQE